MNGWIKLHRQMLDWEWYTDTNVKSLFLHLLFKANFEDKKWRGVDVKRGSLISSRDKLAEELGLSVQQIRTAITKLKSTREITIKSTNKYTLYVIENYDKFQIFENESTIKSTNNLTNEQPTNNHNVIIKEDKKEEEGSKSTRFKPPSVEEIQNYINEKSYKVNSESFFNFYESKGWMVGKNKMKNWKASIAQWHSRNNQQQSKPTQQWNDTL